MEIIHFADSHIGVKTHGKTDPETAMNTRVLDFLDAMDEVIDYAEDEDIDLAVFAGDAFHRHNPNPQYIKEFAIRIKELSEQCPVVLVPGNHDQSAAKRASTVNIFEALNISNIFTTDVPRNFVIETKAGPAYIGCLPYPTRSYYLEGVETKEPHLYMMSEVEDKLKRMRKNIPGHPSILVAHLSVAGGQYGAYKGSILGKEATVLKEHLLGWDYVALGHIHFHQDLGDNVVYSGSLERVDFGEEGEKKGFCHVSISKGNTSYKFLSTNIRPMKTLSYDVVGKSNPSRYVLSKLNKAKVSEDAIVRVKIQAEAGHGISNRMIMSAIECHELTIQMSLVNTDRVARLDGDEEDVSNWTPAELLDSYFYQQGIEEDEIDALLDLWEEVNEDAD